MHYSAGLKTFCETKVVSKLRPPPPRTRVPEKGSARRIACGGNLLKKWHFFEVRRVVSYLASTPVKVVLRFKSFPESDVRRFPKHQKVCGTARAILILVRRSQILLVDPCWGRLLVPNQVQIAHSKPKKDIFSARKKIKH